MDRKKFIYTLLDRYDRDNKMISMARTTGFTCTAMARLMLEDRIGMKGIIPPEQVAEKEENFNFILQYLRERNVIYNLITR